MTGKTPGEPAAFDAYAAEYDAALAQGVSISGEGKNYFAAGRVAWLEACLGRMGIVPRAVLDFGCGTGSAAPFLLQWASVQSLTGVDVSAASIAAARQRYPGPRVTFVQLSDYVPKGSCDLVFCNGVFHHIPPAERPGTLDCIRQSLRPGGLFALWENNPWSPAARIVMSRIPFDADASLVWPQRARALVRAAGLDVLRTDYLFIFPRALRWLRRAEPVLRGVPLGAQYLVLGRRQADAAHATDEPATRVPTVLGQRTRS